MDSNQRPNGIRKPDLSIPPQRHSTVPRSIGLITLASIALLAGAASLGQQNPDRPLLVPDAIRAPDANQQMEMREQNTKQKNFEAANAQRKKEITDDSAKLLALATALKAEVDKTNKDMLSINVIRKADEIEKLAKSVKDKMKLTIGGS